MTPPACAWLDGQKRSSRSYYEEAIRRRSAITDPFRDWPAKRDEGALLHAMGCEAANVDLGTIGQIRKVLNDLERRKST